MRVGVLGSTLMGWEVNATSSTGPCSCCGGELANQNSRSASELVAKSDCLFLSSAWDVTQRILEGLNLDGKLLLDNTQRCSERCDESGDSSGAECVARWARGARVVKVSQTGEPTQVLVCGEDILAKSEARELLEDFGFETVDAGPLSQSRWLERFANLWSARKPLPLRLCKACGLPYGLSKG